MRRQRSQHANQQQKVRTVKQAPEQCLLITQLPCDLMDLDCAGDAFLAVSGAAKIKVFDRDGTERGESVQGDMYIRDQRNTKGHVSPCTYGQWHPTDRYPSRQQLLLLKCASLTR